MSCARRFPRGRGPSRTSVQILGCQAPEGPEARRAEDSGVRPDRPKAAPYSSGRCAGPRRRLLVVCLDGGWPSVGRDLAGQPDREDGSTGGPSVGGLRRPRRAPRRRPPTSSPRPPRQRPPPRRSVDPAWIAPTDRFVTAAGAARRWSGTGPLRTYVVEVEEGIPIDPAGLRGGRRRHPGRPAGAGRPPATCRSSGSGPATAPSFRVRAGHARRPSTRTALPLRTNGIYSCRQGAEVMINARALARGRRREPPVARRLPPLRDQPRGRPRARARPRRLPGAGRRGAGDDAADQGPRRLLAEPLAVPVDQPARP